MGLFEERNIFVIFESRYYRLIMYSSCTNLQISHVFKEHLFLFHRMILETKIVHQGCLLLLECVLGPCKGIDIQQLIYAHISIHISTCCLFFSFCNYLLDVPRTSWICNLVSAIYYWKFSAIINLNIYSAVFSLISPSWM